MEKPLSVEQFIENAVPASQSILNGLRAAIKHAFPNIEEKIGYGVPQYKLGPVSFGLSVAKRHVTFGFSFGAISDEIRKQLEGKGYKLGLQTLQIKFTQAIPKEEIQAIFRDMSSCS